MKIESLLKEFQFLLAFLVFGASSAKSHTTNNSLLLVICQICEKKDGKQYFSLTVKSRNGLLTMRDLG